MKDEMNILREVGSISAAHASTALSEILGTKISLNLPSLNIINTQTMLNKLAAERIVVSVYSQMLSGLKGNILFLLDEKSAFKLIDTCYNIDEKRKKNSLLTEMGTSIIKEVGSVVISSYIGSLSIILKTLIIPSVPTLVNGPIQQIMNMALSSFDEEKDLLLIETFFEEPRQKIEGSFYLALNSEVVKDIMRACKKMLKSINKSR